MVEVSASVQVERSLAKIARDNDRFHAVAHLDAANARSRASAIDVAPHGPLHGLTFIAKDLIDVAELPTAGGSRLFDGVPAREDAAIVRELQSAGAVVIGKSNMHELAVGGAKNPWFGQVINPRSQEHGTGGTSSGSVAAVAAGFVDFALGTDSGGSNRSTAAATGVYGYKPTNGLLPVDGIRPVSPTMDTVGLLAEDPAILSRVFAALTKQPVERVELAGRVVARPNGLHAPVDQAVNDALVLSAETLKANGSYIVEIEIAGAAQLAAAGRTILRYEFFREYGATILSAPQRVGRDVQAFVELAANASAAQYQDALSLVAEHRTLWLRQMQEVDALMMPSAPGLAPRLEDEHTNVNGTWVPYGPAGAELRMWANTIGIPAVAIPVLRAGGLPASIQLAGRPNADGFLLGLSAALGRAIGDRSAAPIKQGN